MGNLEKAKRANLPHGTLAATGACIIPNELGWQSNGFAPLTRNTVKAACGRWFIIGGANHTEGDLYLGSKISVQVYLIARQRAKSGEGGTAAHA